MNKVLSILLSVFVLQVFAQSDSCNTPTQFFSNTSYAFPNTAGNVAGFGSMNCLGSTPNPTFFYLQIADAGNLVLAIAQYSGDSASSGSLLDVDFLCWGPYFSIPNCSVLTDTSHYVDCSYSASPTETCTINNAQTGQYYMLMVTNFSNQAGNISIAQVGGTGSASNGSTPTPTVCYTNSPSVTYSLVPESTPHVWDVVPSALGGTAPYTYVWTWGDGTSDSTLYTNHTYTAAANYNVCLKIIDSNGCTNIHCQNDSLFRTSNSVIQLNVTQATTGIASLGNSALISIYPNPAKNILYVQSPEANTKIEIIDLLGKTVLSQVSNSTTEDVNIQSLSNGTYFVKITDSKGVYTKRFVVE